MGHRGMGDALRFVLLLIALAPRAGIAASAYQGQVTTGGDVPVPGAMVTAVRGEITVRTITDQDGVYRFADLADGVWAVTIEMAGFATVVFEVTIPPPARGPMPVSALTLLPIERIVGHVPTSPGDARTDAPPTASAAPPDDRGFQRVDLSQTASAPMPFPDEAPADTTGIGAAAGLLIEGSVNNAASSPFAQARAFGTNRPNPRSLYTYAMGAQFGHSGWDARPRSLTGAQVAPPSYANAQFLGTFQGPVRLPRMRNMLNLFVGYQGSADNRAISQSAVVPTALERAGDFSQSVNARGLPITILDPLTGLPFPGNAVPPDRISPQAAALLGYYPAASPEAAGRFNYQAPILTGTRRDNVQTRLAQSLTSRNQLSANVNYDRGTSDMTPLLGFPNSREQSGLDTQITWSHRFSPFATLRTRYQFTRQTNMTLPHFSNVTNVSGDAGIQGNNQDPVNWGPPSLVFASDLATLSDVRYAYARNATHTWAIEMLRFRGRHNLTFGGEVRRHTIDHLSQQDPRGTFTFTGAATGSDVADFLLGLPQTGAIAFGNADKYFRHPSYAMYFSDDWRLGPSLTLNFGVRWEYEAPITERHDRLVNLDVTPDFSVVAPVLASSPVGPLTGIVYPRSLVTPDWSGLQPRVGIAWRPLAASSLVVRAGYGIYRSTNVYESMASLLAQQPPLSTAFNVATSPDRPLTLADGFTMGPLDTPLNTFAVDPGLRVGMVQNWQISAQRELPYSLTMVATYQGAKGSRLMQQFLPNTYPPGAGHPCPSCPSGFRYLTSNGRSMRNALELQVRRRLRNGFSSSVRYTRAKAMDNAAAFAGATLDASALAQNWLDLDAEYAPSNFDQRHQLVLQAEYTTGAGLTGGTLLDGWKGRLLKDWTFTTQLTTGSGLPLTPIHFAPVGGTGIVGSLRASLTGASTTDIPAGRYLNPAAYTAPAPGAWGTAGRNSVTGPAQFSFDAAVARTFRPGDRLNLDFRIEATNVLNRVTYAGVNTLVTSPQFGLPTRTNDMRRLLSSLRVRF
jgi:trimeric autotransporter adhesin